jgi:hypothetical protein
MTTLLHVGAPRTGTTSIWNFFKDHTQVSVSIEKEPIWKWDKSSDSYLDNFIISNETKVLLDCTPIIVLLHEKRQYFRDLDNIVDRRCCLYTVRSDAMRRVMSYLEVLLADYYLREQNSILIRFGKISMEKLEFIATEYVNDFKLLQMIEEYFGEKNVFVVSLKNFNNDRIKLFDFLDIDSSDKLLEHNKNQTQFENTSRYLNYLRGLVIVRKFMAKKEDELNRIIDFSKKEILNKYGIE